MNDESENFEAFRNRLVWVLPTPPHSCFLWHIYQMCPAEAQALFNAAQGHDLSPETLLEMWSHDYDELPDDVRDAIAALQKAIQERWGLVLVEPYYCPEDEEWQCQLDGWWQPTEPARRLVAAMRKRGLVKDFDNPTQRNER